MANEIWAAVGRGRWKEVVVPRVEVQEDVSLGEVGSGGEKPMKVRQRVGFRREVRRGFQKPRVLNEEGLRMEVESEGGGRGFWRYGLDDVYRAALWVLANKGRATKREEAPFALAWNLLEFMQSDPAVEKALWLKVLDLAARGREQALGGGYSDNGGPLMHVEALLQRLGQVNEDFRGEVEGAV